MDLLFLCLKIFFARIIDVSLGTVRTVYSVKGKTLISGMIAFIEVTIWFLIVKEAMSTELNSIWIVISYAGGYSIGTIIGTYISKTSINSLISVFVILKNISKKEITQIRKEGYGVSVMDTKESYDEYNKSLLLITLNSRNLISLKKLINKIDNKAFMVINESKVVNNGFIK